MQREILFRGQRLDNKEWVEGFYVAYPNQRHYIWASDSLNGVDGFWDFEVDPKTVGQFTGLTDKNGAKIFEGDIVEVELSFWSWWFIYPFHPTGHDGMSSVKSKCQVMIVDYSWVLVPISIEVKFWDKTYEGFEKKLKNRTHYLHEHKIATLVRGNIHENPEPETCKTENKTVI